MASHLVPKDGTAQLCKTSAADTITRICVFIGTTIRLSTSNKRSDLTLNLPLESYNYQTL